MLRGMASGLLIIVAMAILAFMGGPIQTKANAELIMLGAAFIAYIVICGLIGKELDE